jgi:hypothetical protein
MSVMKRDNKTVGILIRLNASHVSCTVYGKKYECCLDNGFIKLEPNKTKKIADLPPMPICSMEDILPAIDELFRKHHLRMVRSHRRPRIMNPNRRVFKRRSER